MLRQPSRWRTVVAVTLAAIVSAAVASPSGQPMQPIIGILSNPLEECPPVPADFSQRLPAWVPRNATINACVTSYPVRLLASVGVRSVVFPWNLTAARQRELMASVNGVWIPGGGLWGRTHAEYKAAVASLYHIAWDMNVYQDDPLVVWANCYGFELLMDVAAEAEVVAGNFTGMDPAMLSMTFDNATQPTSRLWGDAACPGRIRDILSRQNSTVNWHDRALPPQAFDANPKLRGRFTPLSYSIEPTAERKRFVASVEATRSAEIYAAQFHPDRPPYDFFSPAVGHTADDIAVSHYVATFLAERMRRNNHTFPSDVAAEALRVTQWPILDAGWGTETYFVVDPY